MIAALDVGYTTSAAGTETGRCAVVAFDHWQSTEALVELVVEVPDVRPYIPGRLFERELPCLIAGLQALATAESNTQLTTVIVDGNVRLDNQGRAGLGMHLWRHLGETVPVVGVAKSKFAGLRAVEVLRGCSTRPLYVTTAGTDERDAARQVQSMPGEFRIPTLIKRADELTRSG